MIRPVNIGMAVGDATVEVLDRAERLRLGGMAAAVVAVVAHARHANLQQLWVIAAVWFVAVGAIFQNWRVLPKEGTAPLGMAAPAIFIGRRLHQHCGIR